LVLALGFGAAVHLGHPIARRLVATSVNRTLASVLVGRVVIDRIGSLGLTGIDDVDAHVDDATGQTVVRLEGVHARLSTGLLLRRLFGGRRQVDIDLPLLSAARVDVMVASDESGSPRVSSALAVRQPPSPAVSTSAGPPLRLRLSRIQVARTTFDARPTAPIDGEIDGLAGSLSLEAGLVTLDIARGHVAVAWPPAKAARGDLDVHLTTAPLRVRAHWNGAVGDVAQALDLLYGDGRLDAVLDVPDATPAQLKTVWPAAAVGEDLTLHAEGHGMLPEFAVDVRATAGRAWLDLAGSIDVGADKRAALHLSARDVNLRAIAPGLPMPDSNFGAEADISGSAKADGELEGDIAIDLPPSRWDRLALPAAAIRAHASAPPGGLPTGSAELVVRQPGAPTAVTLEVSPEEGAGRLGFDLEASAPSVEGVPSLETGPVQATSHGTIDLGSNTLAARLSATLEHLSTRAARVDVVRIDARAGGGWVNPVVDVDVAGENLILGGVRVSALRATTRLVLSGGVAARNMDVDVAWEGDPVHAHLALLRVSGAAVDVSDAEVLGLGTPISATVRWSPARLVVQAKAEQIDLARVGAFTGVPILAGTAGFDVDAAVGAGEAEGRLSVDVNRVSLYGIREGSAHVEASVHGRRVAGLAGLAVEDVGSLEARSSNLTIGPGRLTAAAPWRTTWGALEVRGRVDLAKLEARLPRPWLPVDLRGSLDLDARVVRDTSSDSTPGVDFTLRTSGLEVGARRATGSWRIRGLDPDVRVLVNGDTGRTEVAADLRDASGSLASLRANSSDVPYAKIFSAGNPAHDFLDMPFDLDLVVPPRALAGWPSLIRPAGVAGQMQGRLTWRGAVSHPLVDVTANLSDAMKPSVMTGPIDLALNARYDGDHVDAKLEGTARKTHVVDAVAAIDLRASDVLGGSSEDALPWKASIAATLEAMPLRILGALYDRGVRGTVSGQVKVEGLHENARAAVDLALDGLNVADIAYPSARLRVALDDRAFDAALRIDQADGSLDARAHAGSHWGSALWPSLDSSQPAHLSLAAKQARLALLLPLVSGSFTQIDGRVDANARVDIDPVAKTVRPEGRVALRHGSFELTTFGSDFHDAAATLTFTPEGVVRLTDAVAHGLNGTLQAAATARFAGFDLQGARMSIRVPKKDPLPLVFDGVQMGMLDGAFELGATRSGAGLEVDVDVSRAQVQLPTISSSLDVQSLNDLDGVEVGMQGKRDDFIPISLDASRSDPPDAQGAGKVPTKIVVRLGQDVHVSRGADLDLRLEGEPTVVLSEPSVVRGQIRLPPGGRIEVQGKPFEIENGAVTFVGPDPTNPQVVLTAGWSAPDGTHVYADYIGSLKTAEVRLRSSPARSQNEILALLLYGSSEEATASAQTSTTTDSSPFAAAAGGVATQQLNQALGGVNRALSNLGLAAGISTKIDTSQISPRPEVEVQIARDISLQIAWVLGAPPPGTNPDTTLLSLDWHFLKKWSLEATRGDAGTSILNVIWQHRY
jgi:translocation and assembly module TamB